VDHHPSHFWLVFTVAGINVALGLIASEAAARRDDDRTFLVSMALLVSAGFLGLHALATPGILLDGLTAGFSVAARIGLLLASVFAAVSALGPGSRVVRLLARNHRRVRVVLWVVLAAWAVASLARVPLLDRPLQPDALPPPLGLLTLAGVALYGVAAIRYADLYRRRHRPLPLAVLVAFILMAEAMIAVTFARTWHAMWWEWHVLMALAFGPSWSRRGWSTGGRDRSRPCSAASTSTAPCGGSTGTTPSGSPRSWTRSGRAGRSTRSWPGSAGRA
jgi:adenylate cyclase